jgi:MerR family transcriptional regulator, redox-sensitive transcriptional activator SoxR
MPLRPDLVISIQEMSRRSEVSASKLRFYEKLGLLPSKRSNSAHRRYSESTLQRINYITHAQRAGFSLEEIAKQLARLPTDRAPTQKDWAPLAKLWGPRIDQRIAELKQLKIDIDQCTRGGDVQARKKGARKR